MMRILALSGKHVTIFMRLWFWVFRIAFAFLNDDGQLLVAFAGARPLPVAALPPYACVGRSST